MGHRVINDLFQEGNRVSRSTGKEKEGGYLWVCDVVTICRPASLIPN